MLTLKHVLAYHGWLLSDGTLNRKYCIKKVLRYIVIVTHWHKRGHAKLMCSMANIRTTYRMIRRGCNFHPHFQGVLLPRNEVES